MIKKTQEKPRNTSYKSVRIDDRWLRFSNFKKWYDKHYPYELEEEYGIKFEIDKDLLSDGDKIYSPETCIFLPNKVNNFLANKMTNNTSGHTGVIWHKQVKKWRARINDFHTHKKKSLGLFVNIEDASEAYKVARENEALKVKEYMTMLGYEQNIIDKIK